MTIATRAFATTMLLIAPHSPTCWYGEPDSQNQTRHRWFVIAPQPFRTLDSSGRKLRKGASSQSEWVIFGCNCSNCDARVAVRVDQLKAIIDQEFGAKRAIE